jgi:hypothetical protein
MLREEVLNPMITCRERRSRGRSQIGRILFVVQLLGKKFDVVVDQRKTSFDEYVSNVIGKVLELFASEDGRRTSIVSRARNRKGIGRRTGLGQLCAKCCIDPKEFVASYHDVQRLV